MLAQSAPTTRSDQDSGLIIKDVSLSFGSAALFKPLSLTIPQGEIALLMAPSGAGKSTLLSWICGMPDPALKTSGSIILNGKNLDGIAPENRRIGIMFQDPLMFPHLTVAGNLAFGMKANTAQSNKSHQKSRREIIDDHLDRIGLSGMADRDPLTLSGGQKARLALMRCLLADPDALLLDEPFSGLDDDTRTTFSALVHEEITHRNLPVLMVSHDPRDRDHSGVAPVFLEALN